MRIGTWNLNAECTKECSEFLENGGCDIWLLTEAPAQLRLAGFEGHHFSKATMKRGQHYAAIFSKQNLVALDDPHPASAAAVIGGITYCSSILPWTDCFKQPQSPWTHTTIEANTRATIESLRVLLQQGEVVWGGDWNQTLHGSWKGTGGEANRVCIQTALDNFGLEALTAELPHYKGGELGAIDHIAVPKTWHSEPATLVKCGKLSDHDAYIVEVHTEP